MSIRFLIHFSIFIHLFKFSFINFYPFISILIKFFYPFSIFIHYSFLSCFKIIFYPCLSILRNLYPFLSIPIHSYPFLSILIHSYPFLSILIHSYPFLFIPIHSYPFLSVLIHFYQFLSILIHSYHRIWSISPTNPHEIPWFPLHAGRESRSQVSVCLVFTMFAQPLTESDATSNMTSFFTCQHMSTFIRLAVDAMTGSHISTRFHGMSW